MKPANNFSMDYILGGNHHRTDDKNSIKKIEITKDEKEEKLTFTKEKSEESYRDEVTTTKRKLAVKHFWRRFHSIFVYVKYCQI